MRQFALLLLCVSLCKAHLYDHTKFPTSHKKICVCCDSDGCDEIKIDAPRPMPITLHFYTPPVQSIPADDWREE